MGAVPPRTRNRHEASPVMVDRGAVCRSLDRRRRGLDPHLRQRPNPRPEHRRRRARRHRRRRLGARLPAAAGIRRCRHAGVGATQAAAGGGRRQRGKGRRAGRDRHRRVDGEGRGRPGQLAKSRGADRREAGATRAGHAPAAAQRDDVRARHRQPRRARDQPGRHPRHGRAGGVAEGAAPADGRGAAHRSNQPRLREHPRADGRHGGGAERAPGPDAERQPAGPDPDAARPARHDDRGDAGVRGRRGAAQGRHRGLLQHPGSAGPALDRQRAPGHADPRHGEQRRALQRLVRRRQRRPAADDANERAGVLRAGAGEGGVAGSGRCPGRRADRARREWRN